MKSEYLYELLNNIYPVSKESFELYDDYVTEKKFKAKSILFSGNEIPKYFYIVKSGMIRSYIVKNDKEFTHSLFKENQIAGPLTALITNASSNFIFETITDCEIYMVDYAHVRNINNLHLDLCGLGYKMLESFYIFMEKKVTELATTNATERYLNLKKNFNGIEDIIPQYQIASVLGVTPIQLSRIRKQLNSKQLR